MSTSRFVIGATTLLVAVALTGCVPESSATTGNASAAPPASSSAAPTSSPNPTANPTADPTASDATVTADISLPDDCTQIYSAGMLATLEQNIPPLNDPRVTMYPTENATLLENLEVLPTLRCSWGQPSEVGLATNVSVVDAAQSNVIAEAFVEAGYGCDVESGATFCRIEQRGVSLDDAEYTRGETHALRGNVWVATAWVNFAPVGYTEDILATLGG